MSKELDRARNLCARRPIPIAIRELLEPLAAAAPEEEKADFDDLYGIVSVLLPLPKMNPSKYGKSLKQIGKKKKSNRKKK